MANKDEQALLENYAANFIIHTRVNNGSDIPSAGAVDRFNARAMANDPFRGGANPILSRINGFRRDPRLLDHDPDSELDRYGTTLQLTAPVEYDTLAEAFEDEMPDAPELPEPPQMAAAHTPVLPGTPRVASEAFLDQLAAAFKKK